MLYNWHRDYNPALGRYDQFDPTGLNGGINGYAYANGIPTSLVDPSGLLANDPLGPIVNPTAPTPTQIPAPPSGAAPRLLPNSTPSTPIEPSRGSSRPALLAGAACDGDACRLGVCRRGG